MNAGSSGSVLRHLWPLRSLRYRALVLVVGMVVLPLVMVWVAGTFEPGEELVRRRILRQADAALADAVERGEPLEPLAARFRVHARVLRPDGSVAISVDRTGEETSVADPFWGPEGPPTLAGAEADAGPVAGWPEVLDSAAGPADRCGIAEQGRILVCAAARRLQDGRVVHVDRGWPRLVRSLYEQRFQLTALTLIVLAIGVSLALWVGWRMVRPIEQLRDQVVARTDGVLSTEPVVLDRSDELGELAKAFNQLLRALDDRNRANTAFAADLAHELKNPVAAVQAAAEALGSGRPLEGERLERLQRVLTDASRRMGAVVHQFLELARAEAGLPDREREPVPLLDLARHLAETLHPEGAVEVVVEGEDVSVLAVPERLETAIRNLVVNAVGFAEARVRVTVARHGDDAELAVSDDGPGIPADQLPLLFTRYHSTRRGGTGLGLAMTKAIVEAHGGALAVESAEGRGTVFRLTLPIEPGP